MQESLTYISAQNRLKRQKQIQTIDSNFKDINLSLINSIRQQNADAVKQALKKGADSNYIYLAESNGWYAGNTDTPFSIAIEAQIIDPLKYVQIVQLLLQNGADANILLMRGDWNRSRYYSIFDQYSYFPSQLLSLKDENLQVRMLEILSKHNIKLLEGYQIFSILNIFGMLFKSYQIEKLFNIYDIYQIRKLRQDILISQFKQQMKKRVNQEIFKSYKDKILNSSYKITNHESRYDQFQQEDNIEQEKDNFKLIYKIIQMSQNVNILDQQDHSVSVPCFRDYENQSSDDQHYLKGNLKKVYKNNILHLAIVHNRPQLVKLLIDKGIDPTVNCVISVYDLCPPSSWSEQWKIRKINKDYKRLQISEKKKKKLYFEQYRFSQANGLERDQQQNTNENSDIYYEDILNCEFRIFKCKRFSIQNCIPLYSFKIKKISCLQLARKLNVSRQITQSLQRYIQQWNTKNQQNISQQNMNKQEEQKL